MTAFVKCEAAELRHLCLAVLVFSIDNLPKKMRCSLRLQEKPEALVPLDKKGASASRFTATQHSNGRIKNDPAPNDICSQKNIFDCL